MAIDPFAKFNQILESITKAGLLKEFHKQFTNLSEASIEVKNDTALKILKAHGIIESINESGDWGLSFAPKTRIPKKNGSAATITEVDRTTQRKERFVEHMVAKGATPREARIFVGLKEPLPEGLTKRQQSEYSFVRRCGLNEADALVLVKMPLRAIR